ncbi:PIN domain-containing protein [Candidatus Poribacteria bacterium]|jgi:predicted nucleic acid-binding protein|nr:PIN domain-containing protein [Candidatus Poribacteria bacterium]MBT5535617.1 PIN domain-containing protein [Candidatus Poribacteria bacterium]MBT5710320.1 PIN domain-containing protein [Candidatus Poribacteria bacterium]MBT7099405.1 PIN domain-containing protein [Candidatus Poribacteria bacterium]MBT7808379.1 PIN domain-containing protein [Candidatus Poribacteria bacterium]
MTVVLDACAMIAYLRGEPGWDTVAGMLADPDTQTYAHAVNLCEVYYDTLRVHGLRDPARSTAEDAIRDLERVGVVTRSDMDGTFWRNVGVLKATYRVSIADAFAIALTARLGATLVSSDHHELDRLDAAGVCPLLFIR